LLIVTYGCDENSGIEFKSKLDDVEVTLAVVDCLVLVVDDWGSVVELCSSSVVLICVVDEVATLVACSVKVLTLGVQAEKSTHKANIGTRDLKKFFILTTSCFFI
jgi:hypothetical protein